MQCVWAAAIDPNGAATLSSVLFNEQVGPVMMCCRVNEKVWDLRGLNHWQESGWSRVDLAIEKEGFCH